MLSWKQNRIHIMGKKESLPTVSILVGRCWLKKYERTFRAIEAHVHEKYSSKVEIASRLKKQSPVVSVCALSPRHD